MWAEASSKRKTSRGPSKHKKAAAIDTAAADIIDWLAENPNSITLIKKIGDALADEAINEVDKLLGPEDQRTDKRTLAERHFWCDILAALAQAIAEYNALPNQVLEYITSAILHRQKIKMNSLVDKMAVKVIVKITSEPMWKLFPFQTESTLQAARILAILICPAPEDHPAVTDHCIRPLVKNVISTETKERLDEIFSPDWLSRTRRSLAS